MTADREPPAASVRQMIRFRHVTDETGNDTYTLWPERTYDDGWIVGWCPELQKTMIVNPKNVVSA